VIEEQKGTNGTSERCERRKPTSAQTALGLVDVSSRRASRGLRRQGERGWKRLDSGQFTNAQCGSVKRFWLEILRCVG
jgi:hypothetical protein